MPTAQSSKSSSKSTTSKNVNNAAANANAKTTTADVDKLAKETEVLKVSTDTPTAATTTAAAASGTKTPPEQPEFIKQSLIVIEKKVRNLEKRRQKLDEYKEQERKGKGLNEDQLSALTKYDEVIRTLELTKDLEKSFMSLANDAMKQQKKQAKRDQMEKEESISEAVKEKLKEAKKYLVVLETFIHHKKIRNEFLDAPKGEALTKADLKNLEDFDKLVNHVKISANLDTELTESVEHLLNLIDAKPKAIGSLKLNYNELKALFDKILVSPYWSKKASHAATTATTEATAAVEVAQPTGETEKTPVKQHENAQPVEQQHHDQVQQQQVYTNQESTSDADYVLVNANDVNDHHIHQQNQKQPQQHTTTSPSSKDQHGDFHQQHKTTFFTTLNQTDLPINEFINKCENDNDGLNFLQDSEIRQHQQQQQQQNSNANFNQQEFNQNDRDGQFRTQRGGRGGNNGNYQNKPRNSDEQRRNNGEYKPRGGMQQQQQAPRQHHQNGGAPMNGGAPVQHHQQQGGFNNGGRGGNRSGAPSNRGANPNGGGFRGGNNNNGGGYRPRPAGQNNYAPRGNNQEMASQHAQPV